MSELRKYELESDGRMAAFVGCSTYSNFLDEMVPDYWFKKDVPDDVKKSFRVIKKLLEFSYFEYEFCDVAALKSGLSLEMALKIRYQELSGESWVKKVKGEPARNLSNLMNWFCERHYFEVTNEQYLKHIRWMRNYWAHPERHSFIGPMNIDWVRNSIDFINDIYEDPNLRYARFQIRDGISSKLQAIVRNGAHFISSNMNEVIYDAQILFIDNKVSPVLHYFAFYPTDVDHGDNSIRKKFILSITEDFKFSDNLKELTIMNFDSGKPLIVKALSNNDEHIKVYDKFQTDRRIITSPGFSLLSYDSLLKSNAAKYFHEIRRAFHKK